MFSSVLPRRLGWIETWVSNLLDLDPMSGGGFQRKRLRARVNRGATMGNQGGNGSLTGCGLAVVRQTRPVTTSLLALVARSAPGTVDALGPVVAAAPFGVGKGMGVLLAASAFLFGAMVLGGYLGAASRRRKHRVEEPLTGQAPAASPGLLGRWRHRP